MANDVDLPACVDERFVVVAAMADATQFVGMKLLLADQDRTGCAVGHRSHRDLQSIGLYEHAIGVGAVGTGTRVAGIIKAARIVVQVRRAARGAIQGRNGCRINYCVARLIHQILLFHVGQDIIGPGPVVAN